MNNYFIEEFAEKCSNEFKYFSEHESDEEKEEDNNGNNNKSKESKSLQEEQLAQERENRKCVVTLKNIPFRASKDDMLKFCDNFDATDVSLPTLEGSTRSAGYALITFSSSSEAKEAAEGLDKKSMGGRDIYTRQHLVDVVRTGQRKLQDNSRYYVPTSEALQLGASHGMKSKQRGSYKPRNPCFLCAREGHTAGDCPVQVCFRCQHSGHLAKDCQPKNYGRLSFCTMCGANNKHSSSDCQAMKKTKDSNNFSKDNGGSELLVKETLEGAECINCRKSEWYIYRKHNTHNMHIVLFFHVHCNVFGSLLLSSYLIF